MLWDAAETGRFTDVSEEDTVLKRSCKRVIRGGELQASIFFDPEMESVFSRNVSEHLAAYTAPRARIYYFKLCNHVQEPT
jgi:hypothetical protein